MVGEIFPANLLEKLFRDLYARRTNEHAITDRIVREIDPTRFREITESALEGLAKKELNLSAIVGKSVEAKEGRLVPEAIEDFFVVAAPETGIQPQEVGKDSHIYRVGKVPRTLIQRGTRWSTGSASSAGNTARSSSTRNTSRRTRPSNGSRRDTRSSRRSATMSSTASTTTSSAGRSSTTSSGRPRAFWTSSRPRSRTAAGRTLHRRLFVVETDATSQMTLRQPTVFHDINPAPKDAKPVSAEMLPQPDRVMVEQFLFERGAQPLACGAGRAASRRDRESRAARRHQPERPDRPARSNSPNT